MPGYTAVSKVPEKMDLLLPNLGDGVSLAGNSLPLGPALSTGLGIPMLPTTFTMWPFEMREMAKKQGENAQFSKDILVLGPHHPPICITR